MMLNWVGLAIPTSTRHFIYLELLPFSFKINSDQMETAQMKPFYVNRRAEPIRPQNNPTPATDKPCSVSPLKRMIIPQVTLTIADRRNDLQRLAA